MAKLDDLLALAQQVAVSTATLANDIAALKATAADLRTQITALQAQVAAGGGITEAQLQPLQDALASHEAVIEGLHAQATAP